MNKLTSIVLSPKDTTESGLSEKEFLRLSSGCANAENPKSVISTLHALEKMKEKVERDKENIRNIHPNQEPSAPHKERLANLNRKHALFNRIERGLSERLLIMQEQVNTATRELKITISPRPRLR